MWAAWLATGRPHLGYPRRAAFLATPGGGASHTVDISDERAGEIDKHVNALPLDEKTVVLMVYVKMRTWQADAIAKQLRIHRDTLYARLHRAHLKIMEAMQDE